MGFSFVFAEAADQSYKLYGTVTDAETGEPVSFAYIHLEDINRNVVADVEGNYQVENIPAGEYTLSVHRIGYRTSTRVIQIQDDLEFNIQLEPSMLSSQSVEVVGEAVSAGLEHASRKVFGEDLRRELSSTLSGTLAELPGFDQQTMGSAPGRPVIRGLGDERVLILKDGMRSGDVSDQSADHAVTVDPITAQEVEIARGPAALAYGANAIAGVINVITNDILTNVPSKINGTVTMNGETVNKGLSGAIDVDIPYKDIALSLTLNGRTAGETTTPVGTIENTQFNSTSNTIGLSYIKKWGYIGGAFSTYFNNYGIPPSDQGHDHGVTVEMQKFQYDLKSEVVINTNAFKTLESEFSLKNYAHREIESSGITGTEFGLVTTNFEVKATHEIGGIFKNGSIGIWTELEDYAILKTGTPDANSYKLGMYLIEEANFGRLHLEGGLRYDWVLNQPKETGHITSIGLIEAKYFNALSSSVSAIFELNRQFSVGSTLLHSFRAPSLEELYSEGPHLASYSYEVGNPHLKPERALAKELFFRFQHERAVAEAAVFHNKFNNYLYARDTGRPSNSNPNLNVYQFEGTEALLYGFELSAEVQLLSRIALSGSVSYTVGERILTEEEKSSGMTDSTVPLPQIPPLKAKTTLKYMHNNLEFGGRLVMASSQERVGEFEEPTDGYAVLDGFFQYRLHQNNLMHTFALNLNNVLNQEYYNHLSRIKELRPEAGFNLSLLYRLYF